MSRRSLAIILLCTGILSAVTASAYMNSVSVFLPNSPPVAMDDTYTLHGNGVIGPMVNNDSDPDGDPITATILTTPTYGSLSNVGWGRYSYSRSSSTWTGTDSFTYKACDNQSACSSPATVTINVVNQAPTAVNDSYNVHGYTQIGPFRANDSDADGDPLTYTPLTSPAHGTLTVVYASDQPYYRPAAGYVGPDSFTYKVCDNFNACSAPATVNISVNNMAPVPVPDAYTVYKTTTIGPFLANDYDPDPDPFTMGDTNNPGIATYPAHGTLYGLTQTDTKSFVPHAGYSGTDSFSYRICDNLGVCSTAVVTLYIISDGVDAGPTSCRARIGEPINVTNGNMYLHQRDYALPAAGPAIELTRTYNSSLQNIGLFGRGWSTPYDVSLQVYDSNLIRLNEGDGRTTYFGRPIGSSGAFIPLQGDFHGQVVSNAGGYALTTKDGGIQQFSSPGKLLSITDRFGNSTTLTYDANGLLTTVTDPFALTLTFSPNAAGRVTSISDGLGTVATYTYMGDRLTSVTYADNSKFTFGYDGNFRLTTVTDALGNIVEAHTYDSQGRALTSQKHGGVELYTVSYVSSTRTDVTDALGRVTKYTYATDKPRKVVTQVEGLCDCGGGSQIQTWTYDNQLNVTSKTDGLNHTVTCTYDANGNRLTETDATGTVTYTYNQFGQVLTRTDQMSGVTTNTYDAAGNQLTTKDALNNTTTMTYDSRGQLLTATDARGKVTTYTWDASGRLSQQKDANNNITNFSYDSRARVTSSTNALNETTSYEYDLAGRMNKIIHPDTNFILFTYDLAGRRTKVRDPRGNETTFVYDASYRLTSQTDAANQTTSFAYDLMSNLTAKTDALSRVTNYEYDNFNRLKKVIYPPATVGATRLQETIEYDAAGNLKKRIDTAGRETNYLYDAADRLTRVTDAANQATNFEYNARSQNTAVVDALNQRYDFAYDPLGRVTQLTRAALSMSYVYDAVGNRTQRTDYNNNVTNYAYDNLNRLTTITYPDATTVTYGYDVLSRLTAATNSNGTVTFGYDNRGRVATNTDVFNQTIGYAYDANGNRTAMTLNAAAHSTYQYDAVNRLINLADSANQNFPHAYDATNRLISRSAPNGVTSNFGYDGLDRLTSLNHVAASNTLIDNQYTYNNANNISGWNNASGNHGFNYDSIDRLTSVTNSAAPNENYSYDAVGNRTSSHLSASYNYQPFNRLTNTSAATYTYDNNGNLTSRTDALGTTSFAWNKENQLTQVSLPGGLVVNYKYDALDRRIQRTTNAGMSERYVYDAHNVLVDLNADSSVAKTYLNDLGIDDHLRQTSSVGGTAYFLTDHLGSTAALADANGDLTQALSYDSFGNHIGSSSTRYTYTGRERDTDTGLVNYRTRWYDPDAGRFLSEDPIGFGGGDINLYVYVHNRPIALVDPFGEQVRADARWRSGEIEDSQPLADAVRRMPRPQPSGCTGAGWGPLGAIGDFWGNYHDMRDANTIGGDKFFHCMANCEAARRGRSGRRVAGAISELRELYDENIKGDPPSACNGDRYANDIGRAGGSACKPCHKVCGQFKPSGLVHPVLKPAPRPIDRGSRCWGGARGC
ncbi:MAG TPA: Ig-like domain-containing protein [Pyrinomonadaceae bacterium]|nr:Ig-like domain-containing protein [Pyrinomonadaceae bacterium]